MATSQAGVNRAVWFDIYVDDLERATGFYQEILATGVRPEKFGDVSFAVLDHDQSVGGCLIPRTPGTHTGSCLLLYLNLRLDMGEQSDGKRKMQ